MRNPKANLSIYIFAASSVGRAELRLGFVGLACVCNRWESFVTKPIDMVARIVRCLPLTDWTTISVGSGAPMAVLIFIWVVRIVGVIYLCYDSKRLLGKGDRTANSSSEKVHML